MIDAADADALRANIAELPGFGEMKVKALGAVLASASTSPSQGPRAAASHPRRRRVAQELADYQAAKRAHKAEWSKARASASAL